MSIYAIAKLKLKNVNKELLKVTLKEIAKELGGEVKENVVIRGYAFEKKCDLAIVMNLPYGNGYGVEITKEGVVVHVDQHGAPLTAEEFAEKLNKEYTTQAVKLVLQQFGYTVHVERSENKNVILAYEVSF